MKKKKEKSSQTNPGLKNSNDAPGEKYTTFDFEI